MSSRSAYGGQAVIEGVMIRGKERVATACRKPDGTIVVQRGQVDAFTRHPVWRLAFLRGTPALIDSLRMGYRTLMWSAEQAMEGEPEQQKLTPLASTLAIAISIIIAVGFFMVLPALLTTLALNHNLNGIQMPGPGHWLPHIPHKPISTATGWGAFIPSGASVLFSLTEGVVRVLFLIGYILLVSRSKEVKRVFAYHGAEHKVVNGYEAGAGLTVDAVQPYSRIHPRCGTSFIFLFFVVGILMHSLIGVPSPGLLVLSRIVMIPIIAGIAYELIRLAGRFRDNLLLKVLVYPGMLLQRLTTAEPEPDQIEVALASMRAVLEDEGEIAPAIPVAESVVQSPESEGTGTEETTV